MFFREFLSEQANLQDEEYPENEEMQQDPEAEEDMSDDEEDLEAEEDGTEEVDPKAFLEPFKKYFLIQKIHALKHKVDNQGIGFSELDDLIFFLNDLDYNSILVLTGKIIDMILIKIKEVENDKIKTN